MSAASPRTLSEPALGDPGLLPPDGKRIRLKKKVSATSTSSLPLATPPRTHTLPTSHSAHKSPSHKVSFGSFQSQPHGKSRRMTSASRSRSRERERNNSNSHGSSETSPLLGKPRDLEGGSLRRLSKRGERYSRSSLFSSSKNKSILYDNEEDAVGNVFTSKRVLASIVFVLIVLLLTVIGTVWWSEREVDQENGNNPSYKLPPPNPGTRNPAYLVKGKHGAVATEVDVCSEIGVTILREGGNAVDAGIAGTLCVGVVNMFSSGIGGGGFLVIRPPDSQSCSTSPHNLNCSDPITIDFRETAPKSADLMMFNPDNWPSVEEARDASRFGGLAVAIPGELKGLEKAWEMWGGGVSWERVLRPSIELAKGFPIGLELAHRIQKYGKLLFPVLKSEWKELMAPNGEFLKVGEVCRRPALARTLEKVAKHGSKAFYEGEIAESLVRAINGATPPGKFTLEDFANYKVKVKPALRGSFRNRTVYTTHAPGGGVTLLSLLHILENYGEEFVETGQNGLNSHRFIEAMKFTFAARTEIGDPDFNSSSVVDEMVTKKYAKTIWRKIDDDKTFSDISHYNPHYYGILNDHGTTHISAADKSGLAIAITSTVNLLWGSQILDPETGVILNDEMDDFSTPKIPDAFGLYPSPYNFPEPGKRPMSSTSPTIIENSDGTLWLTIGGSGGSRIFGGTAQVILNLDWGYDVSNAIETQRIHHQLLPNVVTAEGGIRSDVLEGLLSRGHNITVFDINSAVAEFQAVLIENKTFFAASDSRKNGVAAAY